MAPTEASAGDLVDARRADASDRSQIVELAAQAADEARPARGGALLLDHDADGATADQRVGNAFTGSAAVFVGTVDTVVVGYCFVSHSGSVAMVDEIFVHPDARGIGVAAALLRQCRRWAIDAGCAYLESHVLPGNRAAKNFFERVGMVTRKMRVSTQLRD